MTVDEVLRTLKVAPFQQSQIHLVDGRNLLVRHPEIVRLIAGGRIAIVENAEGLDEAIDILMIVSLRPTNERI